MKPPNSYFVASNEIGIFCKKTLRGVLSKNLGFVDQHSAKMVLKGIAVLRVWCSWAAPGSLCCCRAIRQRYNWSLQLPFRPRCCYCRWFLVFLGISDWICRIHHIHHPTLDSEQPTIKEPKPMNFQTSVAPDPPEQPEPPEPPEPPESQAPMVRKARIELPPLPPEPAQPGPSGQGRDFFFELGKWNGIYMGYTWDVHGIWYESNGWMGFYGGSDSERLGYNNSFPFLFLWAVSWSCESSFPTTADS